MDIFENYPELLSCSKDIDSGLYLMINTYKSGGKILVCGNGGSCADSDHIVGELMKGFLKKRPISDEFAKKLTELGFDDGEHISRNLQGALPAISLCSQSAILSAFANDVSPDFVYAQMVYGYAKEKDLVICISTSGNSKNVVYAAKVARSLGAKTIALTGANQSALSEICDICIKVPSNETYRIQEYHLPIYHFLCAMCEKEFFGK